MKIPITDFQIELFLHYFEQLLDVLSVATYLYIQVVVNEIFFKLIRVKSLFKAGNSVIKITIVKINKGVP